MHHPKNRPLAHAEHIQYCDLSAELDHILSFIAFLSQENEGYGEFLYDYLGRRAALEHVFFNRYIGGVTWDELKLKAEIWRVQKMKASLRLKNKSASRTPRPERDLLK